MTLFDTPGGSETIPLVDGELAYMARMALPSEPEALLAELIASVPWRAERLVLWGKPVLQPRLTAWYGDADKPYAYSGIAMVPRAWTALLQDLRDRVQAAAGAPFNSCLLNFYRDGRDSIAMHSDDERALGERPVVASLSLGEVRTLVLRHRRVGAARAVRIPLASGSLLVMRGTTQRFWRHGIDKVAGPCGARVSLTFRQIVPAPDAPSA